jgi:hypothetical protein
MSAEVLLTELAVLVEVGRLTDDASLESSCLEDLSQVDERATEAPGGGNDDVATGRFDDAIQTRYRIGIDVGDLGLATCAVRFVPSADEEPRAVEDTIEVEEEERASVHH